MIDSNWNSSLVFDLQLITRSFWNESFYALFFFSSLSQKTALRNNEIALQKSELFIVSRSCKACVRAFIAPFVRSLPPPGEKMLNMQKWNSFTIRQLQITFFYESRCHDMFTCTNGYRRILKLKMECQLLPMYVGHKWLTGEGNIQFSLHSKHIKKLLVLFGISNKFSAFFFVCRGK